MKAAKLHILSNEGRALCMGKRPAKSGTEPCERCNDAKARRDGKADLKRTREEAKKRRQQALTDGILFKQGNGMWALRYILGGRTVEQSLSERSERRAQMMAPLAMAHIRRTSRRLRTEPTCFADLA